MSYLRTVISEPFSATFSSGAKTTSYDTTCFFAIMDDKATRPEDLNSYIDIALMMGGSHDFAEIRRIAKTFTMPVRKKSRT
jgi:hypothetical protein